MTSEQSTDSQSENVSVIEWVTAWDGGLENEWESALGNGSVSQWANELGNGSVPKWWCW